MFNERPELVADRGPQASALAAYDGQQRVERVSSPAISIHGEAGAFILCDTTMAIAAKRLFICLDQAGFGVSLERLKIYVALPDAKAERTGYLRIIDESGEDYLYPRQRFVAADLPVSTRRAVLHAALTDDSSGR